MAPEPGSAQWGSAEPVPRSLRGELVSLIAEQTRRVPVARYLSSVAIALLLLLYTPAFWPLAWLASVVAVLALRTRVLRRLPADPSRSDERKLHWIAWLFAASGLAQAALVGFFPLVPVTMAAVITIFIVGLAAGTLHATAGFRAIYLPYIVVTMVPVGIGWTFTPGLAASLYERTFFIVLVLIFSTTLLSHAKGAYGVFSESYNIRLQRLDLTRRLQAALAAAESANRAKTRFLAAASHDLRQPIHALSLFSGSLLQRQLDGRSAVIAEQIDKAVRTLASQMDALLDVSRLDAGVIERSIAAVDLGAMLDQLAEEFGPQVGHKGLRLAIDCPPDTRVRTDALLFLRILRNLLSNAVKYTESGRIDVTVTSRDGQCRVAVRDTGPGIPASEHERIFEEFYQLQNSERDRTKGLGLGLAIVRRLAELLDIELHLESAPGRGSCFSVDVPVAQDARGAECAADSLPSPAAARIDVLVVDDEEAIRLGMQTLLEEMGYGVRTVSSTDEALDATREWRPSIVLADFRLRRDDDGMRAIRALRERWVALPAVLISGDTAPDRLREARDAGITLLHKPVQPEVLRESIAKALAS